MKACMHTWDNLVSDITICEINLVVIGRIIAEILLFL